jgi:hypothetical protein
MEDSAMRRITILFLFTLIPACQPAFINGVPNERSPYFEVPVDSKLILNRMITIEPAQKSAHFQRGRMLPWYEVNKYAAYCALALERTRDVPQTVKPGEFVVHKVSNQTLFSIAKKEEPIYRFVDFKRRVMNMRDDGGGMTYEVKATVMELRSNAQPEVRRLTCANWGVPQSSLTLTVENIRQSLGDFFSLKLAQ